MKGLEFLKIFYNDKKKFSKQRIEELCDRLDLDKTVLNRKLGECSKGMMQKIGLISAVLEEKKMVILDEPMSGLDPKARILLKDLLLSYKKDSKSIFFSSHILSDIDEICDRIAVLHNKEIKFIGTPQEFKNKHGENILERAFLKEIQ